MFDCIDPNFHSQTVQKARTAIALMSETADTIRQHAAALDYELRVALCRFADEQEHAAECAEALLDANAPLEVVQSVMFRFVEAHKRLARAGGDFAAMVETSE